MVWRTARRASIVPYLESTIRALAIRHLADDYAVYSAIAVALRNKGFVLLPEEPVSRTTLTATMLAKGFSYWSDAFAVVDLSTGCLFPFANSLTINAEARDELLPSYPQLKAAARYRLLDDEPVWYLTPSADCLPTEAPPVQYVILVQYRENAATAMVQAPRSSVLQDLLRNTSRCSPRGSFEIINTVKILQDAACFNLTYGDAREAVDAIRSLVP